MKIIVEALSHGLIRTEFTEMFPGYINSLLLHPKEAEDYAKKLLAAVEIAKVNEDKVSLGQAIEFCP